jgi:hypothetical protein
MIQAAWMVLLMVTGAGTDPARSTLEATTPVDRAQDRCLDHAVKELGMSAKRVENERRWTIGPQFLHPSIVPEGKLSVEMKPTERETVVQGTAQWPGPAKEKGVQAELEDRITAIAGKIAQICGVIAPTVRCTLSDAGAPSGACKGR